MSAISRKIVPPDLLAGVREQLRRDGKTVVQCHGCFDIVHPGHLRYLNFAKEQGDILIVSVTGDRDVGKGVARPYIDENLRAENLAALEFVDYVCVDHHDWAGPVLELLKPDIYVKGKEYEHKADGRFLREKNLVEAQGGKVIYSSGDVVFSSTAIINEFRDRFRLENDQIRSFVARNAISRPGLDSMIRNFHGRRILVIGDPILDRYIHAEALGIAAETPVISVTPISEETYVGAAGLIAAQITALGAHASFLTVAGEGAATDFESRLASHGVEVIALRSDDRGLFVKTRYLVDEKKVFKIDSGHYAPLSTTATEQMQNALSERLPEFDAVIVIDFGYGLFPAELVESIAALTAAAGKPYYVDVSSSRHANILRFKHPRMATPTEQELRFAFADAEAGLSHLASRYYAETGAEKLVMTMGRRGVLLFERPARPEERLPTDFLPSLADVAVDTIGAGDVFLTGVALADLTGAPTAAGVYLGACLASLHLSRLGNDPVDGGDLHTLLDRRPELAESRQHT
ncbi:MAG TPA: PfkB family carbohydrate kinase [Thermoanaerobaculia bacterium]|nr:PfkB family carbohydrate kinase [Thermoanaerobaculia bacterium]